MSIAFEKGSDREGGGGKTGRVKIIYNFDVVYQYTAH